MTLSAVLPSPVDYGFRLASLRWFLRFYQRLRPEIVPELRSRVGPSYYRLLRVGSQASEGDKEAFLTALWGWARDFNLPETPEMLGEAALTLLAATDRPVFALDSFREFIRAMSKDGAERPETVAVTTHAFEFQGRGWTPAQESIEGAASRLRTEFENVLRQHVEAWMKIERAWGDPCALWKRDRKHVRNILWLAIKQACPHLSHNDLWSRYKNAKGKKPSRATIRRGLHAAAECLGLHQIHEARPGRKPRQRSE